MISRLGNIASVPIAPTIISETILDFQHKIQYAQEEYNIPDDLINFYICF